MTIRDRTQEFFATVDSFQQHGHAPATSARPKTAGATALSRDCVDQSSRLCNLANRISESIEEVQQKILQLEELAKLTSNFRDERPKIQQLTGVITEDVKGLNTDLAAFKTFLGQSFGGMPRKHQCIEHNKALLDVLSARYSKLAKSFGTACEVSTKHLQRQKRQKEKLGGHKKREFRKVPLNRLTRTHGSSSGRMHPSAHRNRLRHRRRGQSSDEENKPLLNADGSFNGEYQLKGQQSQMTLHQEVQYNEQRAQQAEMIESQLTEVSQMMTKIATFVDEQRRTIIQIGDNVDDSIANMDGAIEQLQKYLASLSGNRWLMIKVFALLIIFAIIFTIFIA